MEQIYLIYKAACDQKKYSKIFDLLESGVYDASQIEQFKLAMIDQAEQYQLLKWSNPNFSGAQMYELRDGFRQRLTDEMIDLYCSTKYNETRMRAAKEVLVVTRNIEKIERYISDKEITDQELRVIGNAILHGCGDEAIKIAHELTDHDEFETRHNPRIMHIILDGYAKGLTEKQVRRITPISQSYAKIHTIYQSYTEHYDSSFIDILKSKEDKFFDQAEANVKDYLDIVMEAETFYEIENQTEDLSDMKNSQRNAYILNKKNSALDIITDTFGEVTLFDFIGDKEVIKSLVNERLKDETTSYKLNIYLSSLSNIWDDLDIQKITQIDENLSTILTKHIINTYQDEINYIDKVKAAALPFFNLQSIGNDLIPVTEQNTSIIFKLKNTDNYVTIQYLPDNAIRVEQLDLNIDGERCCFNKDEFNLLMNKCQPEQKKDKHKTKSLEREVR